MAETPGTPTSPLAVAAIASAAAAVLHAAAAGIHAEHVDVSRLFIALAVAQAAVAVHGFVRPDRGACASLAAVNAGAVVGWLITRLVGISWIAGLEVAERPQLADTTAAVLAVVAVVAAGTCLLGSAPVLPSRTVANAAVLAGVLLVPGLADATTHDHASHAAGTDDHDDHGGAVTDPVAHDHDDEDHAEAGHDDRDHDDGDHDAADHDAADHDAADHDTDHDAADHDTDHDAGDHGDQDDPDAGAAWPRPWDPDGSIDFSGVDGVSAEQQARAEQLVVDTLRELPAFADVDSVGALGYRSIGDASTGHEHYINTDLINDDKFLDPTAPESLVFEVDGDDRTLVSAMFIAEETPIDSPDLVDFAGPLMQWHVHDNLCWGLDDNGVPVVKGVLETFGGTCPPGTVNAGGENPMVHVWIAPHACGPFAALEGHGAGQASVSDGARMDLCDHDHGGDHDDHDDAAPVTKPYDPELPIDLGGVEGVTPQQQAFAENLVAATVRDLPQWADLDAVAEAGFHSIGDGATGHEHYIQWDWIDDDVWLDPDYPESLVFEPQPDGSKQLVSAMFMLPSNTPLDEVPDYGGALMQWHVHGDLCFTSDPVAPKVAGLKPLGTSCEPPLVDGTLAPMIHVWIRPHECGPFAALDGIGGGQVPEGEEVLCDHAHGSH
jgi:hypothetical protein